jgi:hypothetical protein
MISAGVVEGLNYDVKSTMQPFVQVKCHFNHGRRQRKLRRTRNVFGQNKLGGARRFYAQSFDVLSARGTGVTVKRALAYDTEHRGPGHENHRFAKIMP